jgi:hypothetical protein
VFWHSADRLKVKGVDMGSCRNALEELVIEEAESQYKKLSTDVKNRVDLSEVIAHTLNRLPPMYATTERGWIQQRKRASQDLGSAIAKTVRNGFLNTQSDTLRQPEPIPDHELTTQARSLAKLRKLFSKEYLKWKDVPETVREAIDLGLFQNLSGSKYISLEKRNSVLAQNYAARRRKADLLIIDSAINSETQKDFVDEIKNFESYMSGTVYQYSNILESVVSAIIERRIARLDESVQERITVDDVAAYVLNRLPPMYATSRRGLQNLRQKVKSDMTDQIIYLVKEAINKVMQAPERALPPLPFEKFNLELEDSLVQLRELLGRDDITWRNVAEVVEECLKSPKTT